MPKFYYNVTPIGVCSLFNCSFEKVLTSKVDVFLIQTKFSR